MIRAVLFAAWGLVPVSQIHAQIVNSADHSSADLAGVPRGAIFTILGQFPQSTQSATLPLPTTLGGISVLISCPDAAYRAPLLFVSASQINAIMPSSVPETRCILLVTPGGSLGYLRITGGRFAPYTQGDRAYGPAVVQQYGAVGEPSPLSLTAPAVPGAMISLFGTGLGPLPSGLDSEPPPALHLRDDVRIFVDGIPVTPSYAGRAFGYPGVDQINFKIPDSVRPRCFVPLAIFTGDRFSTDTTIPLSSTGGACVSELGLSPEAVATVASGRTLRIAMLNFRSATSRAPLQEAQAWIAKYDAADLAYLANGEGAGLPEGASDCARDYYAFDGMYGLPNNLGSGSQPKLYGRKMIGNLPVPAITGPGGCLWQWRIYSGQSAYGYPPTQTCFGSNYRFGPGTPVTGTLPQPGSAASIESFRVNGPPQKLTASWSASPAATDPIVLTASSYRTVGGIMHVDIYSEIACLLRTSRKDFSFVFPQPTTAEALSSMFVNPVTISFTTVAYQTFQSTDPSVDAVMIRTSNSVVLDAKIQP